MTPPDPRASNAPATRDQVSITPQRSLTKRGTARLASIVDSAATLFDTVGYAQTTMDQIAEFNGIGKGTLYHYFRHKTEILYEIHLNVFVPQLESALARANEDLPATEELRLLLVEALQLFATHPHHMRVIAEHHREFGDEHRQMVNRDRALYRDVVHAAVARGLGDDELGRHDAEMATMSFLGVLNWSMMWYRPEGRLSAHQTAEALWACVFHGLAPRRQ